jgi:periplasmic divalent cation tolerance protein
MTEFVVCLSTAPSADEAAKIGRALVEEELAACVNVVPGVRSIYRWEGKIEDSPEALLVIKSRESLIAPLTARLKALHSYTVPELVVLPIRDGNPDYLSWIAQSTRKG